MDSNNNDWRLQGQEKYLFGKTLVHKKYTDKTTTTDHDHCEFCLDKFSTTIANCLTEGHTTTDDYHWICENCFNDFKNDFKWTTI
jgi:hypothetical protein